MTRQQVPFQTADLASFAKALGAQLVEAHRQTPRPPGHVQLLNMLARAAGYRNYQSLRARPTPIARRATPPERVPALSDTALKALRQFDTPGRLTRWPVKHAVQRLMLWGLWMRFESRRRYTEREVNDVLNAWHLYGDHCTLRRELVEMRLLERKSDGSQYRKCAQRPSADVAAFMRALRQQIGNQLSNCAR